MAKTEPDIEKLKKRLERLEKLKAGDEAISDDIQKKISGIKERLSTLQKKPKAERKPKKQETPATEPDIEKPVVKLNAAINSLITLFNDANKELHDGVDDVILSRLDELIEQNNRIIVQNEKIASGLLKIADMRTDELVPKPLPALMPETEPENNGIRIDKLSFAGESDKPFTGFTSKQIEDMFTQARREQMKELQKKMPQDEDDLHDNKPAVPDSWKTKRDEDDTAPLKMNTAPKPPF